jgi:phosphomannomutase
MLPALHIGRDAQGVALILQMLAGSEVPVSRLVSQHPRYAIVKARVRGAELRPLYDALRRRFPDADADERDGLRLSWRDRWLHVRPSGTEPIIRYIAEAPTAVDAESLVDAAQKMVHKE